MVQAWRDLFLPSRRNAGLPHLLSHVGLGALALVAIALIFLPRFFEMSQLASLVEPFGFGKEKMIALTNQARTAAGLPELTENSVLDRAAEAKAEDMISRQYFAHNSPSGTLPWQFFADAGYKFRAAGENLAVDFARPEDAQSALMASPTHRANILSPLYNEVGIAVGQGLWNGHPTIFVVEHFGSPASVPVAKAPSPVVTVQPPAPTTTTVVKKPAVRPTASSSALAAVGTAASGTTSTVAETPEVLGTTATVTALGREIPQSAKLKIIALILMSLAMFALLFAAFRGVSLTPFMLARTLAVIMLLGYAGTLGIKNHERVRLTPSASATISVVVR